MTFAPLLPIVAAIKAVRVAALFIENTPQGKNSRE